jgi:hypothetical protein
MSLLDKPWTARLLVGVAAFVVMAAAILARPPKWLSHFDQSFYLTIAYDLEHHGVFSNGVFDQVDSTVARPPPGMFFGPLYPLLVLAATRIDPRFAAAAFCSVEATNKQRDSGEECETYARPIHLLHAGLLALGVVAVALAAEAIFASAAVFWLTALLACLALLPDADLFSFVMTESLTFALYSLAALSLVLALQAPSLARLGGMGMMFGLLALTRPSFVVLVPVAIVLIAINALWLQGAGRRAVLAQAGTFALAWLLVVGPWLARNAVSVGKLALTEEYGSAALIERFAYDDMTAREYALAFPYCLPVIGEPMVDRLFGKEAMARFVYYTPRSFFHVGRAQRDALFEAHDGRLDPLIGGLIRAEMSERGGRYLLVGVPLAWCGLWVGGLLGLILIPLFAAAAAAAIRRGRPLFLFYATPTLVMLALHAVVANHYTRYNLILIGPFSAGAAWMLVLMRDFYRTRAVPAAAR